MICSRCQHKVTDIWCPWCEELIKFNDITGITDEQEARMKEEFDRGYERYCKEQETLAEYNGRTRIPARLLKNENN